MVLTKQVPNRVYVMLVAGQDVSHLEYRERRAFLLNAYCHVAKTKRPNLIDIIGIATEPVDHRSRSEDLIYLDASVWRDEDQRRALELQQQTGILTREVETKYHEDEYPSGIAEKSEEFRKTSNRARKRAEKRNRRSQWKSRM